MTIRERQFAARCVRLFAYSLSQLPGSTLLDEAEFCQWVRQVLALRPTASAPPSAAPGDVGHAAANPSQDEEIRLDLVAAFRVFDRDKNGFITKVRLPSICLSHSLILFSC